MWCIAKYDPEKPPVVVGPFRSERAALEFLDVIVNRTIDELGGDWDVDPEASSDPHEVVIGTDTNDGEVVCIHTVEMNDSSEY